MGTQVHCSHFCLRQPEKFTSSPAAGLSDCGNLILHFFIHETEPGLLEQMREFNRKGVDGVSTVPGTRSAPHPQRLFAQEPNRGQGQLF